MEAEARKHLNSAGEGFQAAISKQGKTKYSAFIPRQFSLSGALRRP